MCNLGGIPHRGREISLAFYIYMLPMCLNMITRRLKETTNKSLNLVTRIKTRQDINNIMNIP